MHKARAFFFVCAGVFLLALAYHLGAKSAGAQAPGNPVVGITSVSGANPLAVTSNGDVYMSANGYGDGPWSFRSNVFSGSPTPTVSQPTWGQLKAKYATPAPDKQP